MDDTTFEFEPRDVTEVSRRFPAHRRTVQSARPDADFRYLATAPGVEFGRHAWDEGGHL